MRYLFIWLVLLIIAFAVFGNALAVDDDTRKEAFAKAEALTKELESKGKVEKSGVIHDYLQALGAKLIKEEDRNKFNIRLHVLKDGSLNAFAVPDGNIYINLGLIAKLDNELQLAQVITHETAHVIKEHSLNSYDSNRTTIKAAHFLDLALFGTGLAYIPITAALMSYSRGEEREADEYSFGIISEKGYDASKADELFLDFSEVKSDKALHGSIWSSHPGDKERVDNIKSLIESGKYNLNKGGYTGKDEYFPVKSAAIIKNTELKLLAGHYNLALKYIDSALRTSPEDAELLYLKGESNRKLFTDPESAAREDAWINDKTYDEEMKEPFTKRSGEYAANARNYFNKALELNPDHLNTLKGLGLLEHGLGNKAAAKERLEKYLLLAERPKDKRFITRIIEECSK